MKIKNKNLIVYIIILGGMLGSLLMPSYLFFCKYADAQSVSELNNQIYQRKKEIEEIEAQISKYKSSIRDKQQQTTNLNNQLEILDEQIARTELEVKKIQTQINQISLEIELNQKNIEETENKIQTLRTQMAEFIRTINRNEDKSYLEIVILYDSLSDFFNQIAYLENMQSDLKVSLDQIKILKNELDTEKINLHTRETKLAEIKNELEEKRVSLESNQTTKNYLLEQTKKDEARYQQLLAQEQSAQEQINNEIVYLERTVRERMSQTGELGDISKSGLIWPVPSMQITAYFHDPDYPFRNIFEHPAIDIRAGQGTTVKAAASGYVARAKDAGMGYSYVMLVHDGGLSTVYGHVSKIVVEEDTYVVQGQTIAYSGGTPGTPGAGRLTTGAHLHFEVRLNGIPVNPLNYLSY